MQKRDYVIRLIEQVVRTIQLVAGMIELRQHPEALRLIDQGFQQWFGLQSSFINGVPLDYLLSMLRAGGRLDVDRCLLMATLLQAEGEVYEAQGETEKGYHRHLRALALRLEAFESEEGTVVPKAWGEVGEAAARLERYALPPEIQGRLFVYYERVENEALAENVLWEWLEATGDDRAAVERGIAFYERLLARPDAGGVASRLSKEEAASALAELRSLRAQEG